MSKAKSKAIPERVVLGSGYPVFIETDLSGWPKEVHLAVRLAKDSNTAHDEVPLKVPNNLISEVFWNAPTKYRLVLEKVK
jgi:hypothetical protein